MISSRSLLLPIKPVIERRSLGRCNANSQEMAHRSLFVLVVDIDIDIVINRGRIFDLLFSCQALIFFNGIFILQMPTHAYSVVVVARIDLLFLYAVEKISLAVVVVDVVVVDVVVVQVVVVVVVCIHRCQQHVVRPYIRRTYVQCYSLKLEHCAVQQLNVTLLATNQKRLHIIQPTPRSYVCRAYSVCATSLPRMPASLLIKNI